MRILNLFADADGESHFREIDVECTEETPWGLKLSKRLPAAAILFVEGTSTNASVLQSPHPTPCRQYVIWLDAEYELTASDGEKRVIGVGEVVLAEDTTGKGHITKPLGEKLAHGLFIPIDSSSSSSSGSRVRIRYDTNCPSSSSLS
jgi:hypothetical protein